LRAAVQKESLQRETTDIRLSNECMGSAGHTESVDRKLLLINIREQALTGSGKPVIDE